MTRGFNRQTGYKSCAFTGYRPQKMPFGFDEADSRCVDFKKRLRNAIEELIGHGYAHFISGGALGMDMFASEAVIELRRGYYRGIAFFHTRNLVLGSDVNTV